MQTMQSNKDSICDEEIINDFRELSLDHEEKSFVKSATGIYQIRYPCPGKGFKKWKKTDDATFYKNEDRREIKVYHYSSRCFASS